MSKGKRIVILADPLDNQYAGIHIYTREMIRSVTEPDRKNEYILIREKKSDDFPHLRQIAVPNLPLWTGYQAMRFFVIFPTIILKLKPDIVIEPAHFGPFNLPRTIKRMTIIHDLTPIKFPELHRGYSAMLQRIFLKRILNKAHLILTNSNNTLKDVKEVFPFTGNKLKMIYPGKDRLFKPTDPGEIRKKHKLSEPYFIFVGTIEPRKNLLMLLKSYQKFRAQSSMHVHLVIAGKYGWKSDAFKEALGDCPYCEDIRIMGYVDRNDLP
ncbi:MAG: glycosyltransferase family 4 protein, partial [Bacteroidales bacterium]|nr:glycosyltransferase family 4 protein [Bacteroidales bacterium]